MTSNAEETRAEQYTTWMFYRVEHIALFMLGLSMGIGFGNLGVVGGESDLLVYGATLLWTAIAHFKLKNQIRSPEELNDHLEDLY